MKHDPEDLFRSHRRMIWSLANSFADRHGLEPTDLESIGDEVFVRCLGRWRSERAAFGTLLYRALANAFADEARKTWLRRERESEASEGMVEEAVQLHDSMERVADLLVGVGADACEVVRVLLDGDLAMRGRETRHNVRAAIRRLLRGRTRRAPENGMHVKWTYRRIRTAFAELDEALA